MSNFLYGTDLNSLDAAALRELVVALQAEIADLKGRPANAGSDSKNHDNMVASSSDGDIMKPDRRDAPADAEPFGDKDIHALPNELLVMIGDYLKPGSRSLLNLARSCRDLYGLLLKRLYKSFSSENFYRNFDAMPRGQERSPWVPSGLKVIECLDLMSDRGYQLGRREELLYRVGDNLVELSCSSIIMDSSFFDDGYFPKLRKLTMWLEEPPYKEIPARWRGAPNLATLELQGYPDVKAMNMFGDSLRSTTRIGLEIYGHFVVWNLAKMSEAFVSKIRSWKYHDIEMVLKLLAKFPTFSPQEIVLAEFYYSEFVDLTFEQWTLLARLLNLERLELDRLESRMILTMPKTLKEIKVSCFDLTVQTDLELQSLAAWLPKAMSTTLFSLSHSFVPYADEPEERRRYVTELKMWEEVPGFSTNVSSQAVEEGWAEHWADQGP